MYCIKWVQEQNRDERLMTLYNASEGNLLVSLLDSVCKTV